MTRRTSAPLRLRGRRDARPRPDDAATPPPRVERRASTRPAASAITAARLPRADTPQDQALYSCGCGYVFQAPVSTSVGCPHCGDAQAW
jgi:hypothetical protein